MNSLSHLVHDIHCTFMCTWLSRGWATGMNYCILENFWRVQFSRFSWLITYSISANKKKHVSYMYMHIPACSHFQLYSPIHRYFSQYFNVVCRSKDSLLYSVRWWREHGSWLHGEYVSTCICTCCEILVHVHTHRHRHTHTHTHTHTHIPTCAVI